MKLEYFLAADAVVIDQITNRVSILQIVDSVAVARLPWVLAGFSAVAGLRVAEEAAPPERRAVLRVGGSAIAQPRELLASVVGSGSHHRLVYRLENVPLEREGEIDLALFVDGAQLGQHTLAVRHVPHSGDGADG
jgi:hypothetical protein